MSDDKSEIDKAVFAADMVNRWVEESDGDITKSVAELASRSDPEHYPSLRDLALLVQNAAEALGHPFPIGTNFIDVSRNCLLLDRKKADAIKLYQNVCPLWKSFPKGTVKRMLLPLDSDNAIKGWTTVERVNNCFVCEEANGKWGVNLAKALGLKLHKPLGRKSN